MIESDGQEIDTANGDENHISEHGDGGIVTEPDDGDYTLEKLQDKSEE